MLIEEAEIFEKIDWSHTQETTDNQNRKIKKVELASGDIAIQILEEQMTSLNESIINEEESGIISRSSFNDGKSKFISFSKKEINGEEHSVAYKDGILDSTSHYLQDYYYSMSYDSDGQISKCSRQKITRPSKNAVQFGEIEGC